MAEFTPSQPQPKSVSTQEGPRELRRGLTPEGDLGVRGNLTHLGTLSKALPNGTSMKDITEFLTNYKGPLTTKSDIYKAAEAYAHRND